MQKAAVRIIMGSEFVSYSHGLQALDLDPLPLRREKLSLNMAVRTCSNLKMKHMFPRRKEIRNQKRRFTEKFIVTNARTNRLKTSAIPYMQGLLNKQAKKKLRLITTNL